MKAENNPGPDYFFTAFDRATDLLKWEAPIPDARISEVWVAAGIDVAPADFFNCWPLEPSQAGDVARVLGWEIDESEARYFIEARQPDANAPPADRLSFDASGAVEDRLTAHQIGGIVLEFVFIMTLPLLAGGLLIEFYHRFWEGGAIFAIGLAIWAWRNLLTPRRAAGRIRAYGLTLPQIRSALAPFRVGARYRVGWLLANVAAAMFVVALVFIGAVDSVALLAAGLLVLNGLRLTSDRSGVRKTAMSYLLIVLIWFGAFGIGVPVAKYIEASDISVLGVLLLGLVWVAAWLTGRVWRFSRGSLADMMKRGLGRPVLFLRSFEDEEHLDAELKDALRPYGPFVGIGKPGELRPDGAARAYFDGEAWRPAIVAMMDDAAVLIVVPGLTPGLDWELTRLAESERLSKTIFMVQGNERERKVARIHACIEGAAEGGQLQAPDPIGAWLAHVGRNGSWVTIKCGRSSTGEIQAALDVALYGVLVDLRRSRPDSFAF